MGVLFAPEATGLPTTQFLKSTRISISRFDMSQEIKSEWTMKHVTNL